MSNQSGITASKDVIEASHSMNERVLVITLSADSTSLVKDPSFKQPSSPENTINALHEYFASMFPEPRYAIVRLDELFFVSFIPDSAPIRQKMLYASTKNTLLQQLGSKFSKQHVLDFTETVEIQEKFFTAEKTDSSSLMTEKERDLHHLDSLQNLTLSQNSAYKKELPSMASDTSLFFKVEPSLDKVLRESLDGKVVAMNINVSSETLVLANVYDNVSIGDLAETLGSHSASEPVYILYGYKEGSVAFIYACPSGCKVKARIMYAANKQGLLNHLKTDYQQQIKEVIEVGDLDEIDVSVLEPKASVAKDSALKFNKPRGPRRR